MAFGVYDKRVSWGDAGKVWIVSYIGNFVGCAILALIFVGAGASGTADYFAGFIGNKLAIPAGQMFFGQYYVISLYVLGFFAVSNSKVKPQNF